MPFLSILPWPDVRGTSPYDIKNILWQGFPGVPDGSSAPFQFALREGHLLVRSEVKPQWEPPATIIQEATHFPRGAFLWVDVTLDMTRRTSSGERPILDRKGILARATDLYKRAGLEIPTLFDDDEELVPNITFEKFWTAPAIRQGNRIPLYLYQCSGPVIVENPDKLHRALLTGIGRKKRFGSGMLLIRPV